MCQSNCCSWQCRTPDSRRADRSDEEEEGEEGEGGEGGREEEVRAEGQDL